MVRKSSAAGTFWGVMTILTVIITFGIVTMFQAVGFVIPIAVIVAIVGLIVFISAMAKAARVKALTEKYEDKIIVDRIMRKEVWQGQTPEQLRDSLGSPVAVEDKVLKTKKKEIWKYDQQGKNRFGTKITLENDLVVGWQKK